MWALRVASRPRLRVVPPRLLLTREMGGKGGRKKAGPRGGARGGAPGTGDRVVLDRGVHKLAKDCQHCHRPMTWRKKWERNWDTVIYCSDKCKKEAAQQRRRSSRQEQQQQEAPAAPVEEQPQPQPQPQPQQNAQ